ncbi:hypothetical protein ACHHYP_14569 [Achlya hypogyna]|uniref:Uncharacterized protein n=1 Tax=Achlya hypogyna TaxID=1202772 RepID=A0A1V9YCY2_ACHHY|nr:hypothetical protein ACHHYP_14569 [Achlya hypogyna]
MEASQAQRLLRKRYLGAACTFFEHEATYAKLFPTWQNDAYVLGAPSLQVVHVDPAFTIAKAAEVDEYRSITIGNDSVPEVAHSSQTPATIETLHGHMASYVALQAQAPLTPKETRLARLLLHVVLRSIVDYAVTSCLADVRSFFLELVVQQPPPHPQIAAFDLLYNVTLALETREFDYPWPAPVPEINMHLELFHLAMEMAERTLAQPMSDDPLCATLLDLMTQTLAHGARAHDDWHVDRLVALSASDVLWQVLRQRQRQSSPPRLKNTAILLEGIIFGLYFAHMLGLERRSGETFSARRASSRTLSSTQLVLPTEATTGEPGFALGLETLSVPLLDVLLGIFYRTPSTEIHRLLFMAFFDATKANLPLSVAATEELYREWVATGLPTRLAMYPSCTDAPASDLAESFQDELLKLMHVADYFGSSQGLANVVKMAKLATLDASMSTPEAVVMQKIAALLDTSEEKFKAERWLAEIVSDPQKPLSPVFGQANTDGHVFNSDVALRAAGRSKFWSMVRSPVVSHRVAMVSVLRLVVQRRFGASDAPEHMVSLLVDVNAIVTALVDNKEHDARVLTPLLTLIFELCTRRLNYYYERSRRCANPSTPETIVAGIIGGVWALDVALLQEVSTEFFLVALDALALAPASDVGAATALAVKTLFRDVHVFSRAGGLLRYLHYLESPDPVVCIFMAELLVDMVKASQKEQYSQCLKDMQVAGQEADDPRRLDNPYVHCRCLLHRFYQMAELPLQGT